MTSINFQRTYHLGEEYAEIKKRAKQKLEKYWNYPDLFTFNTEESSVSYTTERIIPLCAKKRPKVMLLFSNPHPHSVHQGMFLSPNTKRQESHFWPTMRDSGWLSFSNEPENMSQRADIFKRAEYDGPFELIFYCYYTFPTDYPEDIREIFGKKFFKEIIEPEAADEFNKTLQDTDVKGVVTFNKGIFNHVAQSKVNKYIDQLKVGELSQSHVKKPGRVIPIFLTFPTGWRFHRGFLKDRKENLAKIRNAISELTNRNMKGNS